MENTYFSNLIEYDYWANLSVLEMFMKHPDPPARAQELLSHLIAAQRIWIDRIEYRDMVVEPFELFPQDTLLALLEFNYADLKTIAATNDYGQLVRYTNTAGNEYLNTTGEILTHLLMHSTYHRGQIVLLLRDAVAAPQTDYIMYLR